MCKWIKRSLGKITVIGVIIVVLLFSKSVLNTAFNAKKQLLYESQPSEKHLERNEAKYQEKACCLNVMRQPTDTQIPKCHYNNSKSSEKVFLYHVLCIVFIIVLGVTVTVLLAILIKDDSGIRYEKLDELAEIRNNLIESISYKETVLEEETIEKNLTSEQSKTITRNQKSIKADLLKHYMSCITDI